MEATGIYWEAVAEYLADAGHVVSVVNPLQIKAYAQVTFSRTKTDQVDARLIAEFCATQQPPPWQPPPPAVRELRALVARRTALDAMRTQERNRLQVAPPAVHDNVATMIGHLDQAIAQIDAQIARKIDDDPGLKAQYALLDSVPALGERTIPTLLAYYGGPLPFTKTKAAVAFAGLDPRQHQSGSSVHAKPHVSKVGHHALRAALYMPAVVAITKTAWGCRFRDRLRQAGKPPMVIIIAMMRKLVHVAIGVLKSGKPFDPALHAT
jgi:transposase